MNKTQTVQASLGFGYALIYTFIIIVKWASVGIGGSAGDLLIPLILFMAILSIPGFIGLSGKKIPFVFSFVVTVLVSGLVMVMLLQSGDSCGVFLISLLFLPIALLIVLTSGIISGIYLFIAFIVNKIRGKKKNEEPEEVEEIRTSP